VTSSYTFSFHGHTLSAHADGALILDDHTLLVADLHLGKGEALSREGKGNFPCHDTPAGLFYLEQLVETHSYTKRMILLGDSFHRTKSLNRLSHDNLCRLQNLNRATPLYFVHGNHDGPLDRTFGFRQCAYLYWGDLVLTHEPWDGDEPFICGHLHPVVRVQTSLKRFRGRAFLIGDQGVVCPAAGAYAGGLNVCHDAFSLWHKASSHALMMTNNHLYPMPYQHWIDDTHQQSLRLRSSKRAHLKK